MKPQHGHLSAAMAQAFLDGRASETDKRTVDAHVRTCVECRTAFDQWQLVYARLGHLEALEPSPGFATAVMERLQRELEAVAMPAFDAHGHLTTDVILEYVDGELQGPDAEAARTHLAACSDCAQQKAEWTALCGTIAKTGHYAPSLGFSDAVLIAARVQTPRVAAIPARVRSLSNVRHWTRAAVARLRNRDRKGLAVLAGLSSAPAAVAATLMWVVLTHPLVTTGGLFRFALLKAGQLGDGMASTILGGASDSAVLNTLYAGFQMVVGAPGMAAMGGVGLLMLMSLSTWVLFKNLAPIRGSLHPAALGQGFTRGRRLGANG